MTTSSLILREFSYYSIFVQILGYTGNDDARKFFLSGEVTVENIKVCFYVSICFNSLPYPVFLPSY